MQGFSSISSAPSFGDKISSITNEAALRKRSHQHSTQIKPFRQAPKEMPIDSFLSALTSGNDHDHKLQLELAQAVIVEQRSSPTQLQSETHSNVLISNTGVTPPNSNGTQLSATPRNYPRQAYIVLKASPNVSADGGTLICISVFVQDV